MALIFCDSFDHYATATLASKWVTTADGPLSIVSGRNGNALQCSDLDSTVYRSFASSETLYVGFAFSYASEIANNVQRIVSFLDTSTIHLDLRLTSPGRVLNGTLNGTVLTGGVGTISLVPSTWYYIEVGVTIADSNGRFIVRVNGATDIDFTGDTRNGANASTNTLKLGGSSNNNSGWNAKYDDLYICDTSGSVANNFLGDVTVSYLPPNGVGYENDFTPSSGANWETVDESLGAPSDSDYNQSSTSGGIDSLALTNLSATGSVMGVQTVLRYLKADAGTRTIRPKMRIGSTYYNGESVYVGTSALYNFQQFSTSPATASGWTDTEVNAMEFGYEVAS